MKILLTGDWHLRFRKPEMRLDESYFETQAGKVQQILNIAKTNKCSAILQPGDFFDGVETPWFVVQHYLKIFLGQKFDIICSPGQHDLRYHTREIENTPLGILQAANVVFSEDINLGGEILICICRWGEEISELEGEKDCNVLLAHKMVIQKKLWLGQTDFVYAGDLLKKTSFDLIVTGDNHQSFVEEYNGRYLVNCGSLMRSDIDQIDHKPVVYVYDTEKKDLQKIFLKMQPANKVLNVKGAQAIRERDEKLELFISALKDKGRGGHTFDFMDRLYEKIKVAGIDQETKDVLEEVMR